MAAKVMFGGGSRSDQVKKSPATAADGRWESVMESILTDGEKLIGIFNLKGPGRGRAARVVMLDSYDFAASRLKVLHRSLKLANGGAA